MYKLLKRVVISGHPGTGTTTLIDQLARIYNLKPEQVIKVGDLFRENSRQKLGQDITGYYQREITEDLSIDDMQKKLLSDPNPQVLFILESRLGGYFKKELLEKGVRLLPTITVLLTTDEEVRLKRVFERDHPNIPFEEYCKQITKRQEQDFKQWQTAYPQMVANPLDDPSLYDSQIDNTNLNISQTAEEVNKKLLQFKAVEKKVTRLKL